MQIYVETEQRMRLSALARKKGRPAAELIREALTRYLDEEASQIADDDGLFALIGAARRFETASDVASNHHRYLATADVARPSYGASKTKRGSRRKRPASRRGSPK